MSIMTDRFWLIVFLLWGYGLAAVNLIDMLTK
jgi:hypothetical protein